MRGNKRPFSTLIACFAILGMIAGGALAFPAGFHTLVSKAQEVLHRSGSPDEQQAGAHRTDASAGEGHDPRGDDCQASISSILQHPPGTDDVRGLQHAIDVVESRCQKNPNGRGLLIALTHMLAIAQKHAEHASHADGNGGKGNGGGNGLGAGHDPPGGDHGQGQGHANGHGAH